MRKVLDEATRQGLRRHGMSESLLAAFEEREADRRERNVCKIHQAGLGHTPHECTGVLK